MDIRVELGLVEDSFTASSHRIHQLCRFLLSPRAFLSQNLVLLFQCSTRDFSYKSMDAHTNFLHSWTGLCTHSQVSLVRVCCSKAQSEVFLWGKGS